MGEAVIHLQAWKLTEDSSDEISDQSLPIKSVRKGEIPGTHIVSYSSEIDDIVISHTAHSRKGFALGAVLVAEWIKDKKGVLSMDDFLQF